MPLLLEEGPSKPQFDDNIAHGAYDNDGTIKPPPKMMEADEPEGERPRVVYSDLGDRNPYNYNSKFAFQLHPVGQFSNSEMNLNSNDDFKRKKTVKFQDKGLDFPQDRHFNRTDGFAEPTLPPRQGNFVQFDNLPPKSQNEEIFERDPLEGQQDIMYEKISKNKGP